MKTILAIACLLSVTMLVPQRAHAQGTVHTVFGDHRANTADDLKGAITRFPYTWEIPDGKSSVAFKSDGTGKQTFFSFTWTAKNAQEIELTLAGNATKATLRFSDDYTTYTGKDFDGRAVNGSVVMPQAVQATPAPVLALGATNTGGGTSGIVVKPTATPAPANSNPFLDEHPIGGDGGTADSTDALQKAIIGKKFTWEHDTGTNLETVMFEEGGKGQQTFFAIAWRAKSAHEVEISIPDKRSPGKIVLRFNGDYTKYTATDFDGDPLKGHKIAPK